jgi:hypothetical protein
MKKSHVNGEKTNAVYQWLKNQKPGLFGLTRIKVGRVDFDLLEDHVLMVGSGISRNSSWIGKGRWSIDGPQLRLRVRLKARS